MLDSSCGESPHALRGDAHRLPAIGDLATGPVQITKEK